MHPILTPSPSHIANTSHCIATAYPLDTLAVFEARGQDALTFLQGQLTNDIVSPGIGQSRLAGYCTAQGRLLSTMVLGQAPNSEDVPLVIGMMRQDILSAVLKRLSMFVLRSKLVLKTIESHVVGVAASQTNVQSLSNVLGHPLPIDEWETNHASTGIWIAAPSSGLNASSGEPLRRWWWMASSEHHCACEALSHAFTIGLPSDWETQDIKTGLPWIESKTQDLFIPQTLNLELIGGVSFTKGCYPGQEIVARSHYRGTLKKRMVLGKVSAESAGILTPGADIFDVSQSGEPCGRLINVSTEKSGTQVFSWLLFETTFEALDRQQLSTAAENGAMIETVALPYTIR
ncbi:CAF17-like 4Fe-4S cluster assembly/insertion protein YgfZ [Zwartia vadi]|uniref:CAF17-like 4Fe-4S cluster assembly/insertion protein YgfZ n=1 Tax=Zwartia vadi TaxID=3058168 RepID=UPI0025B298E1|nr:folate-binding protein [Zwartia vadi]MDN3986500.1 folate-binding protein [Zwartia vadi]